MNRFVVHGCMLLQSHNYYKNDYAVTLILCLRNNVQCNNVLIILAQQWGYMFSAIIHNGIAQVELICAVYNQVGS